MPVGKDLDFNTMWSFSLPTDTTESVGRFAVLNNFDPEYVSPYHDEERKAACSLRAVRV